MKSTDVLRIERTNSNDRMYIIRWQVTFICNYYCDFCVQGNKTTHIIHAKNESKEIRETICAKLIQYIENNLNGQADILRIYLVGGELTILNDFLQILRRIAKTKFEGIMKIHITTNMSMSIETCRKIRDIVRNEKNRSISLTCSFYKDFTNEDEFMRKVVTLTHRSFYERILDKLQNKVPISASIGFPLCTDQDYYDYLTFKERNYIFCSSINPIIIRDYKTSISQSIKDKLREESDEKNERIIKVTWKDGTIKFFPAFYDLSLLTNEEQYFQPRDFLCDVGSRSITIDPIGNMSRCVSASGETFFGNICTENPEFISGMIRCKAKRCACHYFSLIVNDL